MHTTAATNAMVQAWLGHSSMATTRLYDRRMMRPEDSPTLRVKYQILMSAVRDMNQEILTWTNSLGFMKWGKAQADDVF